MKRVKVKDEIKIAPSILSANFAFLEKEVSAVEKAGADLIHIDIMDGHFVPNLTVGPLVVKALRGITKLPLDVHLMIENPDNLIPEFIKAGSDILTVHVEACTHLHRTLQSIKDKGIKAGVALNPATPLSALDSILEQIDLLLIMSVNPGFAGQRFIPGVLNKISDARKMIEKKGVKLEIEVDGGVTTENVSDIVSAGVNILVAGSAIFESADYARTIREMREIIGKWEGKN